MSNPDTSTTAPVVTESATDAAWKTYRNKSNLKNLLDQQYSMTKPPTRTAPPYQPVLLALFCGFVWGVAFGALLVPKLLP